jgi:hypothetical protein
LNNLDANGNNNRSLGDLRNAPKTKENSPDVKGKMKLQWHTLKVLIQQMEESDTDEIVCCLAGWFHGKGDGKFISVELSPLFVSKKAAVETRNFGAWLNRDD